MSAQMLYPCTRPACRHAQHFSPVCPYGGSGSSSRPVPTAPAVSVSAPSSTRARQPYHGYITLPSEGEDYIPVTLEMIKELRTIEDLLLRPNAEYSVDAETERRFHANKWRLDDYGGQRLSIEEIAKIVPEPIPFDPALLQPVDQRLQRESGWTYPLRGEEKVMTESSLADLARQHNYLVNVSALVDHDPASRQLLLDGREVKFQASGALQWWLTDDVWEEILEHGHGALSYFAALPDAWGEKNHQQELSHEYRQSDPKSIVTVLNLRTASGDPDMEGVTLMAGDINMQTNAAYLSEEARRGEAEPPVPEMAYGGYQGETAQISMTKPLPSAAAQHLVQLSAHQLYQDKTMPPPF